MRPLAKAVTKTLERVRSHLREQVSACFLILLNVCIYVIICVSVFRCFFSVCLCVFRCVSMCEMILKAM